jgi:mannosylglucosylglycerate synthase
MKIALIHYSAPPIVGGVESVMAQHARLFARNGHEVLMIAGRGDSFDDRISFKALPLLDSRHPEVLEVKDALDQGQVSPAFDPLVRRIETELRTALRGVDVLIAHNVCSLNKNLALTTALHRLTQLPAAPKLVLWHHDLAWTTPRYQSELHAGYPWDSLREDWPWATQVVISEMRRQELARLLNLPESRIHVVDNGVDPLSFHKLEALSAQYYHQLQLGQVTPLMLLPVRITPRKNIELALHTLAALRRTHPQAGLVVTGPLGPHNPANVQYFDRLCTLRRQLGLEGQAHFLAELSQDYLPDAVISDFYHLADLLFFPSREEGFGLPVLEAGLAGIPLFCAAIEPLLSLAGAHATFFSPDADPADVAATIRGTLSQNPVYQLRAHVLRNFTWDQIYTHQIAPLL